MHIEYLTVDSMFHIFIHSNVLEKFFIDKNVKCILIPENLKYIEICIEAKRSNLGYKPDYTILIKDFQRFF